MSAARRAVRAVLFDRDGTLVHDVPYNGDPDLVRPVDGAREAVALLRANGVRVGVVTNQSGVARGLIGDDDVRRVNRRIDDLIGPFDVWAVCPHGPDDGCHCRKPQPGMVLWAAGRVCAAPASCVVVGDIGADMEAAERAGAHGILVPNDRTRPEETAAAPHVAPDLLTAARAILDAPPDLPAGPAASTAGRDRDTDLAAGDRAAGGPAVPGAGAGGWAVGEGGGAGAGGGVSGRGAASGGGPGVVRDSVHGFDRNRGAGDRAAGGPAVPGAGADGCAGGEGDWVGSGGGVSGRERTLAASGGGQEHARGPDRGGDTDAAEPARPGPPPAGAGRTRDGGDRRGRPA